MVNVKSTLTGWDQLRNTEAVLSPSGDPEQQHRTVESGPGDSHSPHRHLSHITEHSGIRMENVRLYELYIIKKYNLI